MAKLGFNTAGKEEMSAPSAGTIPAGDYNAKIMVSEIKPCNNGKGLHVEYEVIGGVHVGHRIKDFMLTEHTSQVALDIANGKLTSIIKACGLAAIEDTNQLHGIPFGIKVTEKPNTWKNKEGDEITSMRNEVVEFIKGSASVAQAASPADEGFDDTDVPF